MQPNRRPDDKCTKERNRHNEHSRKGRQKINAQIEKLKNLIPRCGKTNKTAILLSAVNLIEKYKFQEKGLQEELDRLMVENSQLKVGFQNTENDRAMSTMPCFTGELNTSSMPKFPQMLTPLQIVHDVRTDIDDSIENDMLHSPSYEQNFHCSKNDDREHYSRNFNVRLKQDPYYMENLDSFEYDPNLFSEAPVSDMMQDFENVMEYENPPMHSGYYQQNRGFEKIPHYIFLSSDPSSNWGPIEVLPVTPLESERSWYDNM